MRCAARPHPCCAVLVLRPHPCCAVLPVLHWCCTRRFDLASILTRAPSAWQPQMYDPVTGAPVPMKLGGGVVAGTEEGGEEAGKEGGREGGRAFANP